MVNIFFEMLRKRGLRLSEFCSDIEKNIAAGYFNAFTLISVLK